MDSRRLTLKEFNEMVELTQKMFYYLDTFMINNGRKLAADIIMDELKKDVFDQKMRRLRAGSMYEKGARDYYNKHGTVGEF
jgi:DNA-binding response OmpR family regulator